METLLSLAAGIGLAAACGFRVFVPLLILNLAALGGYISLPQNLAWIASHYVTVAFATATAAEILAYYIPWIDNILDTVATPAAVIAGTLSTAAVVTDFSPLWQWTLALIAGGGIAGLVQSATVALRTKSSLATAGLGNPLISTLELGGSVAAALLAIFIPILCLVLLVLFLFLIFKKAGKPLFKKCR